MLLVFDPSSEEFARDPYGVYSELRQLEEPYYFQEADLLLVSRFDDVDAAARNSKLVRTTDSFLEPTMQREEQVNANWHDMPNHEKYVQFSLLDSDGEVHDRLRRIVMKHMSRRFVEQQKEMIQTFVSDRLNKLLDMREVDFIEDLACHVPGHIIGTVLGVPEEDCAQLRIWSENIVQYFDIDRSDVKKALAENTTREFADYLEQLIKQKRVKPTDDLVSALIAEQDAGQMDQAELISTCMLILMAGHGSTIDVLGTGLMHLLQSSDEINRLRKTPDLMSSAVQEMFRIDSPLPFFHRFASSEVEVMGKRYPQGTKFGLLYGAANRDPDRFSEPDRFILDRPNNRHIAFGRGAHLCLGNHLSRIDMEVIFSQLLRATQSIDLLAAPEFRTGLASRGVKSLQIRLSPA